MCAAGRAPAVAHTETNRTHSPQHTHSHTRTHIHMQAHMRVLVEASVGCRFRGVQPPLRVATRCYTRGIPFAPQGTIQDFTSSPRHAKLAEMQRQVDKDAGRAPTGLYEGPTITTEHGAKPLFAPNAARHPSRGPAPGGRPPYAPQFARTDVLPPQSDTYQQDMRSDPAFESEPEHLVAARQRIMTMQSDSFGENPRGIVAPPPPLDPDAPREYRQPRVNLPDVWWVLLWSFAALFALMVRYGR